MLGNIGHIQEGSEMGR